MIHHLLVPIDVPAGARVQVHLRGNAANVMLMDALNYQNYRAGRAFAHTGGYFDTTPVLLIPPYAGTWNVVLDLGGVAGTLTASVQVL